MFDAPEIVQTSTQPTAVLHLTIPRSDIREVMGPSISEVHSAVAAQGIAPAGPWFTHHLRRPTDTFDFEVCIPVSRPVAVSGRVQPAEWPAMTVARATYTGPYEGLHGAWSEFHDWLAANHHNTAPDLYERYLVGPDTTPDPAAWRTELNCPILP